MPVIGRIAASIGVGLLAAGAIFQLGFGGERIRTVEIDIHYSHFDPPHLTVKAGQEIRFVIVNDDPIDHEWIVGDEALHQRHRTGTEPSHGSRPTEQTILAGQVVETLITFDKPGELTYVCHLPGHEAYGMKGTLTVLP
ncbi:MAG TPA: plastocyanin/azurin family copper-binding protein [Candidatus Polarisedimenticolia bacterium]|nr:plastocyanin/azurin family copper-binding protein [Candidatus Polarisedimenticolia bacterium]